MGLGIRIYFVDDHDRVIRIPANRFWSPIQNRRAAKPMREYANKEARYALVIVNLQDRKAVEISRIDYSILHFDRQGRVDKDAWAKQISFMVEVLERWSSGVPLASSIETESILDARKRFGERRYEVARKRHDDEFRWKPTPEIEQAIIDAVFSRSDRKPPLKAV